MGNWNGQVSKLNAAQQEKNHWKRRAGIAETTVTRIRAVLEDDTEMTDEDALGRICEAIEDWEELEEKHERGDARNCKRCSGTGIVTSYVMCEQCGEHIPPEQAPVCADCVGPEASNA